MTAVHVEDNVIYKVPSGKGLEAKDGDCVL